MNKKFLTFGILFVVLAGILIPHVAFGLPCTPAEIALGGKEVSVPGSGTTTCNVPSKVTITKDSGGIVDWIVEPLFKNIASLLMLLSSWVLSVSGWIFDKIVDFSIINMAKNIGDPAGVGGAITNAWAVLRDIANMCFIFVLLFAAFRNMFGYNINNFGKTVKDIIIVALLINFSLFFSKVVIDASNIVAVGFYKSIATNQTQLGTADPNLVGPLPPGKEVRKFGISGGYMNMLGVQSFYSSEVLGKNMTATSILVFGILASVFMLITAVILLMAGIMFAARFIILVFLMILSPLALIAYIIPGLKKHFKDWKGALISQSFFAPLYFALTWVVFKVGSSLLGVLTKDPATNASGVTAMRFAQVADNPLGAMPLIINFVLIIGFSIAALVFAKKMTTSGATAPYFNKIAGGIGAATAGTAAFGGRLAARGLDAGISKGLSKAGIDLQKEAAAERKGWGRFVGGGARLALYGKKKAEDATFDVRNAKIPTNIIGEAIQGTLGRTKYGKKLGLNDVNIPSVAVSSIVKDMDMLGKGGTKGFKALKEESEKRERDREAAAKAEAALAKAKEDVRKGKGAVVGSPEYEAMEKALAGLSEKQTEALVASNRELLKSQSFANAISVRQLEALNKSDQFSEVEKEHLKGSRFEDINMAVAGGNYASVKGKIKGLADSELEMLNPDHLGNSDFVAQMRSSQVDAVVKSGKFTGSQKNKLRDARKQPLIDAINNHDESAAKGVIKRLGTKEITSLDLNTVLRRPTFLTIYTPELLKRMSAEMDVDDISILRADLLTRGNPKMIEWLNKDPGNFS